MKRATTAGGGTELSWSIGTLEVGADEGGGAGGTGSFATAGDGGGGSVLSGTVVATDETYGVGGYVANGTVVGGVGGVVSTGLAPIAAMRGGSVSAVPNGPSAAASTAQAVRATIKKT